MKNILILSVLLGFISFGSLAQGISFEHDKQWAEVVAKAKKENKLIFLDTYTSWCGPCKRLQIETFPNPELGKYFNANFVNAKYDMEKGEGLMLASKLQVRAYPTLFFIDPNTEKVVYKVLGFRNATEMKATGEIALNKKEI